jgi:hypothetical protein
MPAGLSAASGAHQQKSDRLAIPVGTFSPLQNTTERKMKTTGQKINLPLISR